MARVPVDNVGAIGMQFDLKPHELPPEAWSSLRNCRNIDRALWKTFGHQGIMGVPLHNGYYITPVVDNTGAVLWAYCGLTDVSATDGTTHQEITRAAGDYTGTDSALWNGGNFGGITILNNGVDVPQAWITPALGTLLVNLANWPATYRAKVVRPFGRFLVALDLTISGTRRGQLVKWSDEADIGTVPASWDYTDPTRKAGEWPLLDTEGAIIDGLSLGDRFVIYKTDAMYTMTRISGRFVFAFKQIFQDFTSGLLAQRCVQEFNGRHIVATPEDIIIHDGFQYQSMLDDKMLRWWKGRVDQDNAFRSFISVNPGENEAWVCIPESGVKFPNVALILNGRDGTATVRDLPMPAHIASGRPPGASQVYDSFNTPFDAMIGVFGQSQSNASLKRMVGISPLAERNALVQSEDLSTTWTTANATVQTNVEGVADGLRPDATNNQHSIFQSYTKLVAEVQTWTLSAKLKPDGYNFGVLVLEDGANHGKVVINLTTGVVVAASTGGTGFTVLFFGVEGVADAQGYFRCYLTVSTNAAAAVTSRVGVNATAVSSLEVFTGDGTSRIRVKEVQMRRGDLGAYQATTTLRAITGIFLFDSGYDFDGVMFTARAERLGLSIIGTTRQGTPKSDISMKKLVTELWPKVEMQTGQTINIYVGMQENLNAPVTWQGPFVFDPETDLVIQPVLEGRLLAIAFETSIRDMWRVDGYDVEIQPLGKF